MAIKDILVLLDPSPASARRLDVACALAAQHDAHLRGLCVIDLASAGALFFGDDIAAVRLVQQLREQAQREATRVAAEFRARMTTEGIRHEWVQDEGPVAEIVTQHARLVDLTILGQTDPDNPGVTANGTIIEQVLFGSGRPVLMVPYAGRFGAIGKRVLIGWQPTRESARAVGDALTLIAPDANVTVLAIIPRRDAGDPPGGVTAPITAHLAHHGFKVTGHEIVGGDINSGDMLLNSAADESADLLVVGAYGHSRIREVVMGGVTRTLLTQSPLPTLLSH